MKRQRALFHALFEDLLYVFEDPFGHISESPNVFSCSEVACLISVFLLKTVRSCVSTSEGIQSSQTG